MRNRLLASASLFTVLALAACADSPVSPLSNTLADSRGGSNPATDSNADRIRIFAYLTAGADARFPSAKGKAHWDTRYNNTKREIEVEVEHLPSSLAVEFFVGGQSVGSATTSSLGYAELEFSTERGQSVPVSVLGLVVEVRDAAGGVIVSGSFPGA